MAKHQRRVEEEEEVPPPQEEVVPSSTTEPKSKADAIREALDALGNSVPVGTIQDWIREKYGIEVAPSNVYQTKSKMFGGGASSRGGSSAPEGSLTFEEMRLLISLGKRIGWKDLANLCDEMDAS